jgi:hypothetical protein
MHEMVEQMTLVLTDEHPHDKFYGDTFEKCRIVLDGSAGPRFFNCVFLNCSFDPPIPMDGNDLGIWEAVFPGCVILDV